MPSPPINLFGLDRTAMQDYFTSIGEKTFRADQILQWIYHHRVTRFKHMTNLSKILRESLDETAVLQFPEVATEQGSSDGTIKWKFSLSDGNQVETVFIPESERGT